MLTRRDFLKGLLASVATGALVKNGIVQPSAVIEEPKRRVFDMAENTWRNASKPSKVILPVMVDNLQWREKEIRWDSLEPQEFRQIAIDRRDMVGDDQQEWIRRHIARETSEGRAVPDWVENLTGWHKRHVPVVEDGDVSKWSRLDNFGIPASAVQDRIYDITITGTYEPSQPDIISQWYGLQDGDLVTVRYNDSFGIKGHLRTLETTPGGIVSFTVVADT